MPLNEFSEVERHFNTLAVDVQLKIVSSLNFLIMNYLRQQQNVDLFFLVKKFANLLNAENQEKLLADANFLIETYSLQIKKNGDTQIGSKTNDNALRFSDVSKIIDNYVNMQTSSQFPVHQEQKPLVTTRSVREELMAENENIPLGLSQKLHSQATSLLSDIPTQQNKHEQILEIPQDVLIPAPISPDDIRKPFQPPPPPASSGNFKTTSSGILKRAITQPLPPASVIPGFHPTGTGELKSPTQKLRNENNPPLLLSEGMKYIIPSLSIKGKEAVGNLSTPVDTYSFLKQFSGGHSLYQIYTTSFNEISLSDFIVDKMIQFSPLGYIEFKKSVDMPPDKELKLRVGDILISLNLLDGEKLEKAISIQKGLLKVVRSSAGELITTEMNKFERADQPSRINKPPLLGDLLVDLKVINQQQLIQVLAIQKWYNSIAGSL